LQGESQTKLNSIKRRRPWKFRQLKLISKWRESVRSHSKTLSWNFRPPEKLNVRFSLTRTVNDTHW
jgi:hypothetical protein